MANGREELYILQSPSVGKGSFSYTRNRSSKTQYEEVVATISTKEAQSERLADFIKVLKAQDGTISELDGSLWGSMVDFITVDRNKKITVNFRNGLEKKS